MEKIYYEDKLDSELEAKLRILADAAKYDVACTSSGVDRKGKEGFLGNAKACGICHSFAADGRCISLLKILMTNHCVYDCKYCINRSSNDVPRAEFTPEEICKLTMEFYRRNYIEGLFLSSGVIKNPDYTMEHMCKTLLLLRNTYKFNGYIHVKTIPGASDEMLSLAGYLADRISVNMELPTQESLKKLAPNKSFNAILKPMEKVSHTIAAHRLAIGKDGRMERAAGNRYLENSIFSERGNVISTASSLTPQKSTLTLSAMTSDTILSTLSTNVNSVTSSDILTPALVDEKLTRPFAPGGQSTQMIIGASGESDYSLIQTTQNLYQTYDLKRVFYSAYIPINEDSALPPIGTAVPLLREHRLYQADWLMRFYGFRAGELLSEEKPNFNEFLDPKCDWALRHLGDFPVEVSTAGYDVLLRVPGIGPKSAMRIVKSRRYGRLDFDMLKRMGVVLKRAHYFLTCNGKMMYNTPIEENYITRQMIDIDRKDNWQTQHQNEQYHQMNIFELMERVNQGCADGLCQQS